MKYNQENVPVPEPGIRFFLHSSAVVRIRFFFHRIRIWDHSQKRTDPDPTFTWYNLKKKIHRLNYILKQRNYFDISEILLYFEEIYKQLLVGSWSGSGRSKSPDPDPLDFCCQGSNSDPFFDRIQTDLEENTFRWGLQVFLRAFEVGFCHATPEPQLGHVAK